MQPLPRSSRKHDEAVDHGGSELCEAVHFKRRELRGEVVHDEPRPGSRVIVAGMMRMGHLDLSPKDAGPPGSRCESPRSLRNLHFGITSSLCMVIQKSKTALRRLAPPLSRYPGATRKPL